jgi:PhnB protein
MQTVPYLTYDGQCEEAFRFYEKCLGGKIEAMLSYAGSPAEGHMPAELRDKILHARLISGEAVLMGTDGPSDRYAKPNGIWVALQIKDPVEAERVFQALSEGGTVQMPLQETFWALRYGMMVDKFGIPWMVNCESPA